MEQANGTIMSASVIEAAASLYADTGSVLGSTAAVIVQIEALDAGSNAVFMHLLAAAHGAHHAGGGSCPDQREAAAPPAAERWSTPVVIDVWLNGGWQ